MSEPDYDLARRFESGDPDAFSALYDRHTPALYRTMIRLFALTRDEAEDVLQEVWLRAATRLAEFRWQSTLRTWMTGIAVNCCREHIRRAQKGRETPSSTPVVASTSQPSAALRVDLERAFVQLPPGYREVLFLHDVEGLTHREIAGILELNEGTSRSQLFKARAKLRQLLRGNCVELKEKTDARK